MRKLFLLNFLPSSTDLGLLVLRVWLGLSMLLLHGWGKLTNYRSSLGNFPDPVGVGPGASATVAVIGEALCAALIVLGLFTRFASLVLGVVMGVAFFIVHGRALTGDHSGELAFLYLAGAVTLFLAGGGRFSLDRKLGGRA